MNTLKANISNQIVFRGSNAYLYNLCDWHAEIVYETFRYTCTCVVTNAQIAGTTTFSWNVSLMLSARARRARTANGTKYNGEV